MFIFRNHHFPLNRCASLKILWVLSAYYGLYALLGLSIGVPVAKIIGGSSAIHLLDMTLLIAVLLKFCSSENDLKRLTTFLIFCIFTRELYGLVRFIFFGGDVSNVYLNVENINVKLTFQDINDSLLACMAGFYCGWVLLFSKNSLSVHMKLFYLSVVSLSIFTVMFSYRRSSWVGLCLAGVLFVLKQPWRRRLQLALVVGIFGTIIFGYLLTARLGIYEKRGSLLLYDVIGKKGEITSKTGRLAELSSAYETIKENFLFGVGPWGGIKGFGKKDYMHGGILQIWLKLGIIGLVLFLLAIIMFIIFYLGKGSYIEPELNRGWFEAGAAGILFMFPTLSFGTPVIEYRTMQLIGLCLALPYITYGVYGRQAKV
jgi:O-antigen ligase